MIIDRLENLGLYAQIHPGMAEVIAFLGSADLDKLPIGKTSVTTSLYVLRDSYMTKPLAECYFEGHLRYGDVQIVLSGTEAMGYWPKAENRSHVVKVTARYSSEKDVEKYDVAEFTKVRLSAGQFAIVFPEDLHLTKLIWDQSEQVEKAIVKFRL